MSTSTMENVTTDRFEIVRTTYNDFEVLKNGVALTDRNGYRRIFLTRNSARKRIARERSGNFHR